MATTWTSWPWDDPFGTLHPKHSRRLWTWQELHSFLTLISIRSLWNQSATGWSTQKGPNMPPVIMVERIFWGRAQQSFSRKLKYLKIVFLHLGHGFTVWQTLFQYLRAVYFWGVGWCGMGCDTESEYLHPGSPVQHVGARTYRSGAEAGSKCHPHIHFSSLAFIAKAQIYDLCRWI